LCSYTQAGLISSDVFEEVPISVHNSHLMHALLFELSQADPSSSSSSSFDTEFERLALGSHSSISKTFTLLYELTTINLLSLFTFMQLISVKSL
jgi:hypothetical protein